MAYRPHVADPDHRHNALRCVADDAGVLVYASPALEQTLGLRAGMRLCDVVFSNTAENLDTLHDGYYSFTLRPPQGASVTMPARLDRVQLTTGKSYTVIWMDPKGVLPHRQDTDINRDAHEFVTRMHSTASITALRSDDGELRHFLDMTNDLLCIYGRDLFFRRGSPALAETTGYSPDVLADTYFTDIIHPQDRESTLASLRPIMVAPPEKAAQTSFSNRLYTKSGQVKWVEWTCKAVGAHIYILGKDVTGIREHGHELSQREQQLQEAQKIGRMGHWTWKMNDDTMTWSDQIYSIFGVTPESFVTKTEAIRDMILKSDLNRIFKAYQLATLRKKNFAIEFKIRRPAGLIRYIRCEGGVKSDPETGTATKLFGIMQDITERTLHERALRAAKETAESAYASKTRFLANMSHELRTPLNAIIGFSEMIQRQLLGPVGNARYLDYVGGIRESGEHLLDLINDILDMSKIEVGKYELYVEELNLSKLIRLAIHMMEGRAHEAKVRLGADNIAEDIHIVADRRALMQIMLNILSNAVKFTPPKGRIDIACRETATDVSIIIRDTGIGIPADKIDIVTQPFEQVDNVHSRTHKGSGLGLAITKDLIDLHRGKLLIESKNGQGTSVTVTLPATSRNT